MLFERKRYQFGYVRQKPRKTGPHVWVWEYRDRSGSHSVILGTIDQMSETDAWKATEGRRSRCRSRPIPIGFYFWATR